MTKKKQIKNFATIAFFLLPFSFTACKKDPLGCSAVITKCYDKKMYETHKDDFCTTDCIGVIGCNGKKYCNECEANKEGISIKKY